MQFWWEIWAEFALDITDKYFCKRFRFRFIRKKKKKKDLGTPSSCTLIIFGKFVSFYGYSRDQSIQLSIHTVRVKENLGNYGTQVERVFDIFFMFIKIFHIHVSRLAYALWKLTNQKLIESNVSNKNTVWPIEIWSLILKSKQTLNLTENWKSYIHMIKHMPRCHKQQISPFTASL